MKNRKINIIVFIFLIMILSFSNVAFAKTKNKNIVLKNVTKKEIVKPVENKTDNNDKSTESIKIEVGDKSYSIKVEKGSTVYDAMKKLSEDKKFSFVFHTKEYSSMGNFVDSINGVPGTPGKYWLYYLNGKKASMGVSKNKIKSGDVVTWKQESF